MSERKEVCDFFAPGDFVLDFSLLGFAMFATRSIGEMVVDDSGTSVGAAFRNFVETSAKEKVLTLLRDMINYYEEHYREKAISDSPRGVAFRKVKKIVDNAIGSGVVLSPRLLLLGDPATQHHKAEIERALDAIEREDFGSAISKAKSAVEGTMIYAINKAGKEIVGHKDMPDLIAMVRQCYGVPMGKGIPNQYNDFYKGVSSTIDSIAKIRNVVGDSHGRLDAPLALSDVHVRLYVNISAALCEYVMSLVHEKETSNAE